MRKKIIFIATPNVVVARQRANRRAAGESVCIEWGDARPVTIALSDEAAVAVRDCLNRVLNARHRPVAAHVPTVESGGLRIINDARRRSHEVSTRLLKDKPRVRPGNFHIYKTTERLLMNTYGPHTEVGRRAGYATQGGATIDMKPGTSLVRWFCGGHSVVLVNDAGRLVRPCVSDVCSVRFPHSHARGETLDLRPGSRSATRSRVGVSPVRRAPRRR